jgi:hypothetical protein
MAVVVAVGVLGFAVVYGRVERRRYAVLRARLEMQRLEVGR